MIGNMLREQIRSGILMHAYLFWGNDDVTKQELISYIVENIFGKNYTANPNIVEIKPEERTSGKILTIDSIRNIRNSAVLRPIGNLADSEDRTIFVIYDIDSLSKDAAPALLKILEEPPAHCIFLATSRTKSAIPATLRSRFILLRCWKETHAKVQLEKYFEGSLGSRIERLSSNMDVQKFSDALEHGIALGQQTIRKNIVRNENVVRQLFALKKLLHIKKASKDYAINRRLLGEYCMMLHEHML